MDSERISGMASAQAFKKCTAETVEEYFMDGWKAAKRHTAKNRRASQTITHDGWSLEVRRCTRYGDLGVWAVKGGTSVWVAAVSEQGPT